MSFELFHFLRPYWLLLLPVLIMLIWLMVKRKLGSRSWEAICDKHLLPYMLIGGSSGTRRLPIMLIGLCGLLAILSLAGPVWNKLPQPVFSHQFALVIALDLSRSMDANDISPSRVSRARFKIADILNQHGEGQVALLVYAGDAFTVTPLTDDMATINSQLSALTTSIMPVQGNRTDLALKKAEQLLQGAGNSSGDILLVSDEIDLPRVESLARQVHQHGYRISVLGIGTAHGTPVVLDDGSFLKDRRGEIVIPVLDEKPMRQFAQLAGGNYRKMTLDDTDIKFLLGRFSQNTNNQQSKSSEFKTDVWQEQGPWLLLLLIPLAALAFRRGYLIILIILMTPFPHTAQAFDWDSLWLRADQRAKHELDAGNSKAAAQLFKDQAWKGAAQYKAGDYQASVESLKKTEDIEGLYNKGNALARMGQYEKAIADYDKVLEQMPEHEDAKYNKALLEEELKKQQQKKQRQSKQDQKSEKDKNNAEKNQQQEAKDGQQQQEQKQNQAQEQTKKQGQNNEDNNQQQETKEQQQSDSKDNDKGKTPEQKKKQEAEQAQAEKSKPKQKESKQKAGKQQQKMAESNANEPNEEQQATEQWLRRIPDDPAGLLRRKFRYQYQQRADQQDAEEKTW